MLIVGLCIFILFILFNSYLIHHFETEWSISDAVWFTLVTITTVGYGDQTPKTEVGLLINCITIVISAIFLMDI